MKPTKQASFEQLLLLAKEAAENAYAPYSDFNVGAAVLTETGETFTGCNVENASYGLTLCAERNAIASMVNHGHKLFMAIAVYTKKAPGCYPCGACRQWLKEFGPDASVIVENKCGELEVISAKDLLPRAFGPDDLRD